MATFEPAFNYLMQFEDPGLTGIITNDSGGKTKFGISQKAYPEIDISSLTLGDAANLYRTDYWFPIHGSDIQSQEVANKYLDMAVNAGVVSATLIVQKACGDCGNPVVADGHIGPLTISAINNSHPTTLLDCMRSRAKDHYCQIAAAVPSEAKYLNGWLARAEA